MSVSFINVLFACGVVKLVAECSLSGVASDEIFENDGTGSCTLPGGRHTIGTGLTLTASVNTTIQPANSEVVLAGKVTIIRSTTAYNVTIQDITFVYAIDVAQKNFALIRIENGGLVLKKVIFGDANIFTDVELAPIRVKNSVLLTIDDCSFFKFKTDDKSGDYQYGGVINADFVKTIGGEDTLAITVNSSKFINNSIGTRGYGGAFVFSTYSERTVITIQNCEFTDSTSLYYAGAFDIYSEINLPSITVKGSKFTGCTSGRDSGAIWLEMAAPGEIIDCNFTSCTAVNDGGGVYLFDDYVVKGSNYTVKTCKFTDCISFGEARRSAAGAAIFVESTGWTQIESCSFDNCVTNAFHGHGGAISNVRLSFMFFTIKECNFTGCVVDEDNSTAPTPDDDGGDGGAVSIKISLFNTIIIDGCKFINCSASNHGGSLDVEGGSLIVIGSSFTNSTAINGNGGSISTTGIIVTVNTTTFTNSQILNANAKGVEIYSEREIFHYGVGNVFACSGGKNDVIYGDVSLDLVVCEGKEIKDLECSKGEATHFFSTGRMFSGLAFLLMMMGLFLF